MATEEPRLPIPVVSVEASADAFDRKARSESVLVALGVPVLDSLPAISGTEQTSVRSLDEVVSRAVGLTVVAIKGDGIGQGVPSEQISSVVQEIVDRLAASGDFTPDERAFIDRDDAADAGRFTWRYESLWVLLWALGHVDQLGAPNDLSLIHI